MGLRRKIVIVSKPVKEGSACHYFFSSYCFLSFLAFLAVSWAGTVVLQMDCIVSRSKLQ
jgi:hypothetical protein